MGVCEVRGQVSWCKLLLLAVVGGYQAFTTGAGSTELVHQLFHNSNRNVCGLWGFGVGAFLVLQNVVVGSILHIITLEGGSTPEDTPTSWAIRPAPVAQTPQWPREHRAGITAANSLGDEHHRLLDRGV